MTMKFGDKIKDTAHDVKNAAKDTAHDFGNAVHDTAHDVKNAAGDAMHDIKNSAQDMKSQMGRTGADKYFDYHQNQNEPKMMNEYDMNDGIANNKPGYKANIGEQDYLYDDSNKIL